MDLAREYLRVDAERQKLDKATKRVTDAWEAKHPMPDALRVRPGDAELGLPQSCSDEALDRIGYSLMGCDIEEMRKPEWWETVTLDPPEGLAYARGARGLQSYVPSPEARARADEIVAAYDEWHPKRSPRGIRGKEVRSERMWNKLSRLEKKINKTRAKTFIGLLAKGWIACIAAPDPDHDPAIGSLLRDCREHAGIYILPLIKPAKEAWPERWS
jgi:hypothetical protein